MSSGTGRQRRTGAAVLAVALLTACTGAGAERAQDAPTASVSEADDRAAASPRPIPTPVAASTPEPTSSPSPSPSPSPTPPPPPDRSALVALLEGATAALPSAAEVSLAVLDPEGRTVFGIAPDRSLLPASTTKLLTGAAALQVFGPDHTFRTNVRRSGALVDGVVTGPLVLEGGGDPALASDDYHRLVYLSRPWTDLDELAARTAAADVVVADGLVVAPDRFGDTMEAPGWKESYVPLLEARRMRMLTVDGGLAVTVLEPAPNPVLEILAADDPQQTAAHRFAAALAANGVDTGVALPPPTPEPTPDDQGSDGTDDDESERFVPDPVPVFGAAVPDGLPPADGAPPVADLPVVASIDSPPVSDLLRFAFERSDNHISDTLFRLVGLDAHARDWPGSGAAVVAELDALGVDTGALTLADGSGLSRAHAVSARHLASTDRAMRAGEHGDVWREALAVAGEEGTLRRRLRGTVAEGRFLGKTGTLDDVTAVAGTVEGPDGAPAYHVAAIANVPASLGRFSSLVVFDDVIALLAEDAGDCVRPPASDPSDAASTAPGEVVRGLSAVCPAADEDAL